MRTEQDIALDSLRVAAGYILAVERQDAEAIVTLTGMVSLPDLVIGLTYLSRLYAARLGELAEVTPEAFMEFTAQRLAGVQN